MTAPLITFEGKTVVVTGGARGIGRAIAKRFLECGAKVIIADHDESGAETAIQLADRGNEVHFIRCDVSKLSEVQSLVAESVQRFGGAIDVLVNNAGIFPRADLLNTDEAFWDNVLGINLKGAYMLCQAVVPGMIERNSGVIINIGSNHATAGEPATMAYAVSKGGIVTLTRNLAKAFVKHGIRVNCVQPGWVASEGEVARWKANGMDEEQMTALAARLQTGEDIADAVLFMASGMSKQINGQVLIVDGGITLK
ncbi:SDR family NAD(P)-dependent oxidoreductase [Paenibacillus sp. BC26]|uniref:SDR family NAD(P)-dependent oxidoreductase n=1 Tax=Paenibacillus sp. BC26 TaxID=1881032 RepID=UPI0008EEE5BE|nr:SDR family oxidoreductase [Paenibacillus sp. BC26]SFS87466.1 3-oxoacyl-[acyl-carrier protein] reductase/2-hydroxycyclohexanecarboxyl-CoA dehydrogenase [Paenibacillus sp. BC26]